ncbi:MAG: nucleotide pyrophosphohydrolase [Bacteroidota bacterium]
MSHKKSIIEQLTQEVVAFRDERDWKQFHNGKDLALGLSIEAAELNELFLWKRAEEVDREKLAEELADVMNYVLLMADAFSLDLAEIVRHKLTLNAAKYPVEKAKGKASKYTEL